MTKQPNPDPNKALDAISAGDGAIDAAHGGVGEMTKAVRKELYGTIAAVDAAIRQPRHPDLRKVV